MPSGGSTEAERSRRLPPQDASILDAPMWPVAMTPILPLRMKHPRSEEVFIDTSVPGQAFSRASSHGMILVSSIVTGDADLLVLNPFRGIEIVTPAEFLKLTI